jgi:hypothetical protein
MTITSAIVCLVGMVLAAYLLTLVLRPNMGARVGGQIGKGSFFIETKEREKHHGRH